MVTTTSDEQQNISNETVSLNSQRFLLMSFIENINLLTLHTRGRAKEVLLMNSLTLTINI